MAFNLVMLILRNLCSILCLYLYLNYVDDKLFTNDPWECGCSYVAFAFCSMDDGCGIRQYHESYQCFASHCQDLYN